MKMFFFLFLHIGKGSQQSKLLFYTVIIFSINKSYCIFKQSALQKGDKLVELSESICKILVILITNK